MSRRPLLASLALLMFAGNAAASDPKPLPGRAAKWHGFVRHDFTADGRPATVVVPDKALPGRPWVWRGEFFGAFAEADAALVKAGWHLAALNVPDPFGSPKAIRHREAFHATTVMEYGLHPKPGLIGLSRGGLYCMSWAAAHPDKTLAVSLDNAVGDFKSWPGGAPNRLGAGRGSEGECKKLLAAYDFKGDAEATAYKSNPVDHLAPLVKARIPLMLVYGDQGSVVPHAENSGLVFERHTDLGGPVERVAKPGQDHQPHGLKDVSPVVAFFTRALNGTKDRIVRGEIERLDVWAPGHSRRELPEVLLVGDSVTRGYYKSVEDALKGKATVCRLTTSKRVGDPGLLAEVKLVLAMASFDVVHFNDGLHGWGNTEKEYAAMLPELVATIRAGGAEGETRGATTTPVRAADELDTLADKPARVNERNALAATVINRQGIPTNDLFALVIDKPDLYTRDGVHFNPKGFAVLGTKVPKAASSQLPSGAKN